MLKIEHLSKKFGELKVLKDISLDIDTGEVVCIIGPSGSGKSTFLRCINQLEEPTGGIVEYNGKNLLDKKCDIRKFREEVGMVFQKFNLFPLKTVVENVMLATVYKGNIIKNLIMDCQSYTKYRPNETTGGIFVSWRRKEELPTGA